MGNNPIAETREGVPQALSEEVQEKLVLATFASVILFSFFSARP
jgi:hypothetical protein